MARALLLAVVAVVVVTVFSLIDCALTEPYRVRALPRILWLVLILLLPVAGPSLWWTIGRTPYRSARRRAPTSRR